MKIKVCDAPIEVLNYLVAKIECLPKDRLYLFNGKPFVDRECLGHIDTLRCEFSTNWAQGGPIIEREHLEVSPAFSNAAWVAGYPNNPTSKQYWSNGPTPLIAGLRCFVFSKLGKEVEVPDELLEKD